MSTLDVYVDGVGLWSPQLADFESLRRVLDGQSPEPPARRPAAVVLPANERRRAPESVLLAAEVAGQAISMSGQDAATVACVFASSHGDQAITDYMCATLAEVPTELSPIRFHNSVHNAAVGYWTIATGCHAPSTAIAAQRASFGAGLLEAASQACSEQRPVLLVCSDFTGAGPLLEVTACTQAFGCALLLAPTRSAASVARLRLTLTNARPSSTLNPPLAGWRESNPSAAALPLLVQLVQGHGRCQVEAAPQLGLQIDMESVA
ncbi:hypothetical protein ACVWWQ_002984 [Rhodanobacter sp. TND4EL1]